ncbi:Hypothetical protein LBF_2985 [Leptospira biflexa serovar Patoc strain 'Patoc 1 (Ames)']|uniref:Uncharacterized protein n=1 Tax=Leptospira biflexa serovar Patoc (strain Patoc 1 / ATCC 23582 / Paris) TaxID=456481 RepID=B0SPQ4_LEPBP|nr:hypothetical protein [Leptospira biflexa]ABZ95455.1 Hypothetical protein LBF_2985 [Leptospira biflexa serovar Patoc strain 'Patoc 1 (Ames)']ABZ99160.1 Hypothetical protein; putative signal peptide [Leptospira biflexa serovar Patoc strain 'Patoc 1 (Paris)']TGM35772.1 hypothetical protein EHQ89_09575 [Leptospira biflexa]TGM37142.1 hypothetical protein EHQ80_05955 [Leptospira biflexa]
MKFFKFSLLVISFGYLGLNPLVADVEKWKTCLHSYCLNFQLPSNWYLTNRRSNGQTTKLDHFRTQALKDELGREIIPALVILFKESENKQNLNPILFHAESRKYTLITNIKEYFHLQKLKSDPDIEIFQFLGLVGSFKDKDDTVIQHYITTTDETFGIIIIVTCLESVSPQIQKDIKLFLDSLKYEKRISPWKFSSASEQMNKAKELEFSAQTRLKTKQVEQISFALQELDDACELGALSSCELFSNLMNLGR